MTKTITFILLLIFTKIGEQPKIEIIVEEKKSDFRIAYSKICKWEGNYVHHKDDPGGETYRGIARRYNKDWMGWYILDKYKRDSLVWHNKYIINIEPFTLDYYISRWVDYEYYNLKDQRIANYVFDYHNQGPIAAIHISQILNKRDSTFKVTNQFSKEMINKLNLVDSSFIKELQEKRVNFYTRTAYRHPRQRIFLKGWLNRSNDI